MFVAKVKTKQSSSQKKVSTVLLFNLSTNYFLMFNGIGRNTLVSIIMLSSPFYGISRLWIEAGYDM